MPLSLQDFSFHYYERTGIPYVSATIRGQEVRMQAWPPVRDGGTPRFRYDVNPGTPECAFGYRFSADKALADANLLIGRST